MRRATQLKLEALEAKDIPSGGPVVPAGISINSFGILQIKGGDDDDTAKVWVADQQVHASLAHTIWYDGIPLTTPPVEKTYSLAQVTGIVFYGHDGNDSFTNDTSFKSTAFGHAGNDFLVGGSAADLFAGGDDNDTLEGRWGNDDLRGGDGSDTYVFAKLSRGSLGWDTIAEDANADFDKLDFSTLGGGIKVNLASTANQAVQPGALSLTLSNALAIENVNGTAGADSVTGNDRPNVVFAKGGNDKVDGKGGADILYGEAGDDRLSGNGGDDALHGGADNDKLYPGTDNNTVTDGTGNDLVDFHWNAFGVTYTTGGGNDTIIGSLFDDKITGSSGNDRIDAGVGDDSVTAGAGNDIVYGGVGSNSVTDGLGDDVIDLRYNAVGINYTTGGGNDKVVGTDYDDNITGFAGNDKLYGQAGNDHLFGLGGTDEVHGNLGNDWLDAGSAGEIAKGWGGKDYDAWKPAVNGAVWSDIKQAGAGTCLFLSALSGAAMQTGGLDLANRITYLGNYKYNVKLFNSDSSSAYNQQVSFNGTIGYDDETGDRWDPFQADPEEFWTILYQRAFLAMTKAEGLTYNDEEVATYAVTGRSVNTGDWDDPTVLKNALAAGKVVTAGNADDTYKIYSNHSYTVMSVYKEYGMWYIKLRNPWGKDVNSSDLDAGTHQAYGANDDGIIVMKYSSFQDYHDFDRISIS